MPFYFSFFPSKITLLLKKGFLSLYFESQYNLYFLYNAFVSQLHILSLGKCQFLLMLQIYINVIHSNIELAVGLK